METTIKIFKDVEELSHFFALRIANDVKQTFEGSFYSISLSGGSTPRKVFEYMALHFRDQINWQKVQIFWGDERCVDPESAESNFRMAKVSLLDKVPINENNIYRIHGEAEPSDEADRYSEIIRQHVPSKNRIPRFDLMMLGLGDDGHTVSIFPGSLHLFKSDQLCEVSVNPYTRQKRITITGNIINNARTVVFLVTGESKAEMVSRIIEKKDGFEQYPASLVSPKEGELTWILDQQAAKKLDLSFEHN